MRVLASVSAMTVLMAASPARAQVAADAGPAPVSDAGPADADAGPATADAGPATTAGAEPPAGATLAGTVIDAMTLAPIAGAWVTLPALGRSAITADDGTFELAGLPSAGAVDVIVYAGDFDPATAHLVPGQAPAEGYTIAAFRPGALKGEVITIEGEAPETASAPAAESLDRKELTRMPGTHGDPLLSVQSLPGVANAGGGGQIIVRGAAPEDSTITIDGIEVPTLYHFFGVQSVIPGQLIEAIDFSPGGFGVDRGRSTGGALNVVTRDDVATEPHGSAELSFINLAAFFETPVHLAKNLQIAAGVRRSAIDLVLPLALPDDLPIAFTTMPQYYDGQLKVDWEPTYRDHLTLFALTSYDVTRLINNSISPNEPVLTGTLSTEVQFAEAIATWRRDGDRIDTRVTAAAGESSFGIEIGNTRHIRVSDYRLEIRADTDIKLTDAVTVRAGGDARYAPATVDVVAPLGPSEGMPPGNFSTQPVIALKDTFPSHTASLYAAADLRPVKDTTLSAGVRLDYFANFSAATLSPRTFIKHQFGNGWAARAGVGVYTRAPGDAESAFRYLEPERAVQTVAGVERHIAEGITAQVTGYYTDRENLVVQDPVLAKTDPDHAYENGGRGRSFGAELLVRAKRDWFFGWVAYTLSRSDRIDLPTSERRLFDFDQTHNIIAVASAVWGKWQFGGRWQYTTGGPMTPIIGSVYLSDANVYVPVYGEVNSDRIDAAHQLDVRVDRKFRAFGVDMAAFIDITNVYAHARVIDYTYNFDYTERSAVTSLPFLPAFGIKGKF